MGHCRALDCTQQAVLLVCRMQQIKSDWKEIPHIKPSLSKVRQQLCAADFSITMPSVTMLCPAAALHPWPALASPCKSASGHERAAWRCSCRTR